jgi:hypothetical protein
MIDLSRLPFKKVDELGPTTFQDSIKTDFEVRHGRLEEIQSYVKREGIVGQTRLVLAGINQDDELIWTLVLI